MPENKQERSEFGKYLAYLGPSFSVGLGAFTGVGGLAEIVQDIVAKNPIDSADKIAVGIGTGLVMYGIGLLKKAESDYRK
ncbi:MAG TPA: hypothetical protein PLX15_05260 [Candidatus Woesearchaeota archaeon]|nr:hypothetical protein [Candidatus Woesearchaeota archaeon]